MYSSLELGALTPPLAPGSCDDVVGGAITGQAYRAGASYVNVVYDDQHVRRAMIELGPDEALTYSPEWRKTAARTSAPFM